MNFGALGEVGPEVVDRWRCGDMPAAAGMVGSVSRPMKYLANGAGAWICTA